MPVYVRKPGSFVSACSEYSSADNPGDYLQDPALFRDELPQPYRFINEVLNSTLDEAWSLIDRREFQRFQEDQRIKPPKYDCAFEVENFNNSLELCSSPDGDFLFVGKKSGLAVICTKTQSVLDSWDEDGADIVVIKTSKLALDKSISVISTIDDMGVCRLFAFSGRFLFFIQTINEDNNSKKHAIESDYSAESNFLGILLEASNGAESHLDVFKIPKDAWIKDIELLVPKLDAFLEEAEQEKEEKERVKREKTEQEISQINSTNEEKDSQDIENVDYKDNLQDSEESLELTMKKLSEIKNIKFTSVNLHLRVKSNSNIQGMTYSNPQNVLKTISNGDVIGTGSHHQLSVNNLQIQRSIFTKDNTSFKDHIPAEEPQIAKSCKFHFLQPGRNIPETGEAGTQKTNAVAVWWQDDRSLYQYSLVKNFKDGDFERKPDLVWTHSEKIIASAVSPCTSLLALGLRNGNIIIWDNKFGIQRKVCHISMEPTDTIQQLHFLNPSVCPQNVQYFPPYTTQTDSYLLIRFKSSKIKLIHTMESFSDTISDVTPDLPNENFHFTKLLCSKDLSELAISCRQNGQVFVHEMVTGKVLCEICLPADYAIMSPWDAHMETSRQGDVIYLKGEKEISIQNESGEFVNELISGLFGFQLCHFPTLENFKVKDNLLIPFVAHTTAAQRINALMKHRISEQESRTKSFENRWKSLSQEVKGVLELRKLESETQQSSKRYSTKLTRPFSVESLEKPFVEKVENFHQSFLEKTQT